MSKRQKMKLQQKKWNSELSEEVRNAGYHFDEDGSFLDKAGRYAPYVCYGNDCDTRIPITTKADNYGNYFCSNKCAEKYHIVYHLCDSRFYKTLKNFEEGISEYRNDNKEKHTGESLTAKEIKDFVREINYLKE